MLIGLLMLPGDFLEFKQSMVVAWMMEHLGHLRGKQKITSLEEQKLDKFSEPLPRNTKCCKQLLGEETMTSQVAWRFWKG